MRGSRHRPTQRLVPWRAAALCLVPALASCGGPTFDHRGSTQLPQRYVEEQLAIDADELAGLDPALRARIERDPHSYFRFVSHRFVALSCGIASEGPTVNLHGDPHLQQYLVTSRGRGLGDFDEAAIGPVGIDLLRLATSIRIAARMRHWDARALWERFLEGYLAALDDPEREAQEPAYARRARESFSRDHQGFLDHCEALRQPIAEEEAAQVEVALTSYVEMLQRQEPSVDARSFEVVSVGRHLLGVGSRRATNYIIRTRGASDDPADDRVIEAKEVTANGGAWCLPSARAPDPLRILVADSRLSYTPFLSLGYLELDGHPYWVHEWVDNYVELTVTDPALDHDLVAGILFDAGVQLGRGHPRGLSAPFESELRRSLRQFVASREAALWETSETFTDAIWHDWERIR